MNHNELTGLMGSLAPTIADFVSKATAPLRAENLRLSSTLAAVEQKFNDFSASREQDRVVFIGLVKEEIAKIELPKDGKDADPEAIKAAVLDVVAEILPGEVSSAVDKIEKPKDGKDADPEVIRWFISEEVAKIEPPKDGKDGEPGKGVEIEDFIPVIEAEIANAIAAMEPPKDGVPGADGKSVTVDDVRPVLEELVAALPKAQDGKDADPVEIASLIVEDVAKLIPAPADGKSVTVDELAPLVDEAAAKRLPTSFLVNEAGVLVAVYANSEPKSVGKVRGDDGARGASVMDGSVDDKGTLVLRMSDGRIIQTGAVRGNDGEDGKDGQKGERGRDAHEIQILPGVDESKSYVEGVVACWRGGVIRSDRQTDPIVDGDIVSAGWKVFVRGIAEEHETDVDDGRFIERTTVYTDGTEFKRRIKTVTPIYQGVWKESSYQKGDVVTWAGSSFVAQRDTSDKPEVSDSWKLAVKRGRDGKDGKIDRPPPVVKL